MTGNVLIDLAISLTGIVILVGLARLIFPDAVAAFSAEAACARLAFDEPDFQAVDWLVDAKRGAALAVSNTGDIALIKAAGDGLTTRRMRPGDLYCSRDGADLAIAAPDHTFRKFAVRAASDSEAQRWAVRLSGENAI